MAVNENKEQELRLSYAFDWGVNFKQRIILIDEEIDETSFRKVDAALTEMESQNRKTVTIRINSPGGNPYDAMAIVGRMRQSVCIIKTEGYGSVMSAATLILASGDKRAMSLTGWYMQHEASYRVSGRHAAVKATVEQFEREEQYWAHWMAMCSKRNKTWWLKNGTGIDVYFSAAELQKHGVVDEVF